MKGNSHPKNDVTINPSGNESIRDVLARVGEGRRQFLKTATSASVLAAMGGITTAGFVESVRAAPLPPSAGFAGIAFDSIPPSLAPVADKVSVPAGYTAELLVAWGDPIMPGAPPWAEDVSQTAADQEKQFGMHCDGQHFFAFPTRGAGGASNERGVYCVNNEYTHEGILHPDGLDPSNGGLPGSVVTIAKVRKSQAAHGVSICELRKVAGKWGVIATSPFGRRITANTPMKVAGPAAGHALLQSKKYDIQAGGSTENGVNDGFSCNGTINNCAHGFTPWGTYLTCEENWNGNFGTTASFTATRLERRYGVSAAGFNYKWHVVDPRFDVRGNPNETNLFGWVIEIDPFDPKSMPVKRTAMGRFKHESAQLVVGNDNEVAWYQGDDERNEYVYKFVAARPYDPRNRTANFGLLDEGTLYVARFTSEQVPGAAGIYRGQWIALKPDTIALDGNPLRNNPEFQAPTDAESQALILIKTRMAADAVGATMMDRPEWAAARTYFDPARPGDGYGGYGPGRPLEVYCTMTNNSRRGNLPASSNLPDGSSGAASTNPPVDVANPRPDNDYGHIIRWREDGNTPRATGFEWDLFVLCGDSQAAAHLPSPKTLPASYNPAGHDGYVGNIFDNPPGSADFGAPDGLWFDPFGRMWIQTDQVGDGSGDWQKIGANTMLCADPNTKEIRRFLTSPNRCEVTGMHMTPDGKTLFVGIQHPGEDSTAANPAQFSNWPQGQFVANSAGTVLPNGTARRPRSAVVVITKDDGGVIGGLG